jgi:hypothetical protein
MAQGTFAPPGLNASPFIAVDIEKAVPCVWIDAENGSIIERIEFYYG